MCDRPERDEPGEPHQDYGWPPEGLRAELEKGGAEFNEKIAKLHRLGAQLRETNWTVPAVRGRGSFAPSPSRLDRPPLR